MEAHKSSQHFTIEKQRRAPSPEAASVPSPAAGRDPNSRGRSATPTEGGREGNTPAGEGGRRTPGQPHVTSPQLRRRGGGEGGKGSAAAVPPASSLFDTTVLTSSGSTPSGEGRRPMAHLLDSVASSSASLPSSQTPPRGTAWQSPDRKGDAGGSETAGRHRHQHTQQRQREPRPASSESATGSARLVGRTHNAEESTFAELLGETPAWSPALSHAQLKPTPQQTHPSARARPFEGPPVSTTPTSHQHQSHLQQQQQQRQREGSPQKNEGSNFGTPTSANTENPSSVLEGSSFSRDDDLRTGGQGMPSPAGHGDNWASPSEVLRLRTMFHDIAERYQREQTRLQTELQKAQEECNVYASERARVQQLQKSYTEGLAQCERAKQQQAQWTEERALQQLQLEKMMIENQRLQLFIAKKQRLHRPTKGANAIFVPTESQERIRAAVQGVTTAAAAAAAEARFGETSLSPLPVPYWPMGSVRGTTPGATTRPTAAAAPPPLASTSPPVVFAGELGGFGSPPAHRGAPPGRTLEVQGSPYTFLSSESTPQPDPSQRTLSPSLPQEQQQQQRTRTVEIGSVTGVDHTQLPGPANTAASTRGEVTRVSPSTGVSAVTLLSAAAPEPQHRQQQRQHQQHASHRSGDAAHTVAAARQPNCQDEGRSEGDGEHGHRRSSSLATPSLTASGAATTPTLSSLQSAGASVPERELEGLTSNTEEEGGSAVVGDSGEHARRFLKESGRSEGEGEGDAEDEEETEENARNDATGGRTSGEFDPSYARGVTDTSSSSNSHGSNASMGGVAAAGAVGRFIDAQTQRQPPQQRQEELHSSSFVMSGSQGGGGWLTSTTQTSDTPHKATDGAAARSSVATATTTTTTTSTTTPSLLASAAAAIPNGFSTSASSTAASNATAWSLQYLYQLPRTPAEALQEELRMMKELRRLGDENASLEARLQHLAALKAMDADQREQQLLRLAQEHEQARSSAARWASTAQQLQAEVSTLEAQSAETRAALEEVLTTSRRRQQQAQERLIELEASSRAALTATREETLTKMSVLRRTWCDFMREQQQHQRQREQTCDATPSSPGAVQDCERLQKTIDDLRADLHAARIAQTELQDRLHTADAAAKARLMHVTDTLATTHDALDRLTCEKNNAALQIDQLEAEVERLREAAVTREACMRAMEQRLRLATDELATQAERSDDAATWKARAVSVEEELATQRAYYEKEINVYKTAACNMQDRYHGEMQTAGRRYEKLVLRFEAMKLRLNAALSAGVCGEQGGDEWTAPKKPVKGQAKSPVNTPDNSPNTTAAKGLRRQQQQAQKKAGDEEGEEELIVAAHPALQRTAKLACDSVRALRTSVEATDRIVKSLNRAASP
ncbi:hypothetical protein ABB37_07909 [Leptomonas pyrrhocoris]|uniref:Uncharacterized protein n=1 Tax=Leptomonas pyrrhocoris TaxID=157538 RepID=A0A0N0DSI6_LEPPY|nr:hypothetical protein ABB37_07909 [Leptomonas pyrrhocoris]KPA76142.1 hypothetical protein ABB37_07909 [Leptomonas pyrrhocoris]|eukprot:XP_015654581.1 hypothetical protein ABB37_07909 [Leptomonas pyrrhocoris]